MSRAEEQALKAYPIKMAVREGYDENLRERKGFVKGYKKATKDLMEKTVEGKMELNHIVVSYSDLARVFPNGKDGDKVKIIIIKEKR